ncbi:hypothetical protein HELRODRAFT_165545 [Helobdella robusta]|uniref:Uncharacterized protein n=1 Tax=Helobdella robusta TaxID=6412 RepID=T1EX00_HELRO|nr:hypothetical protein HELRODRAFT_165545 [Helobdella robusta]ESN91503.1 hypothetical protein HELRODRAFT_165545 [Helobdella robusta]
MEVDNSVQEDGEDWQVECSDDEKYEIGPSDIINVFNLLNEGKYEFDCKLTRKEETEKKSVVREVALEKNGVEVDGDSVKVKTSATKSPEVTVQKEMSIADEFDLDSANESKEILAPRRTIGSAKALRTTEKKVAQWDKIMNDFLKTQKQ